MYVWYTKYDAVKLCIDAVVIGQIEENQEEIRNMLTYIFKGVFVHRYRCVCVVIAVVDVTPLSCTYARTS